MMFAWGAFSNQKDAPKRVVQLLQALDEGIHISRAGALGSHQVVEVEAQRAHLV